MIAQHELTGIILAGGEGRRMGGRDKGLEPFEGLPLFTHALKRLEGHVAKLLISANRNADAYSLFGHRVIPDVEPGFHGPLMGIYSGLKAAGTPWLMVVPCDTPLLPDNLVERMVAAIGDRLIAVAFDGERRHPTVALMATSLAEDLGAFLARGERKLGHWYERHDARTVDMSDVKEAFINLNSEEEKQRLELGRAAIRKERP
ncbi:molybdenum cofactor guanylyltransferase MobA [Vreelandella sp. EE22]